MAKYVLRLNFVEILKTFSVITEVEPAALHLFELVIVTTSRDLTQAEINTIKNKFPFFEIIKVQS